MTYSRNFIKKVLLHFTNMIKCYAGIRNLGFIVYNTFLCQPPPPPYPPPPNIPRHPLASLPPVGVQACLPEAPSLSSSSSSYATIAAAAAALRRADDWLGQPAFGSAEASAAAAVGSGEVRMFVGVISACCSQLAFERRAVIRDTWGKTLREVGRGRLAGREEGCVLGALPGHASLAGTRPMCPLHPSAAPPWDPPALLPGAAGHN